MILILLTYIAGVLTILSPCILPVLPFVFSKAQGSFVKSGIPLLLGMCFTFSIFSAIAIVGGQWVSHVNEIGRIVAMILLSIFGLSLLFPHLLEKILAPVTQAGSKIGTGSTRDSFGGSFLIGISTGLLWSPCAGPILGLVLTGAASQKDVGTSIVLLLSYSLGAATSLAMAIVAGNKFLGTLKGFLGVDQVIKKGLGVAILLGVVAIALNLDRSLLTQISKFETVSLENKLLSYIEPNKSEMAINEGDLPDLSAAKVWINSKPLNKNELLGKVVLIDFWTYSCINCLRTLPYVKAWAEKYKEAGLVVIGVHTPEFAFEKNLSNVESAVKDLGITYPVAIDNDYVIWNLFSNRYWPAHFFVDREGHIRGHHFGEGDYDGSEKLIQKLLSENGHTLKISETNIDGGGLGLQSAGDPLRSPETYLGSDRARNFISSKSELKKDQWSIDGKWQILKEKIVLKGTRGKIKFRFYGRDLHLVLGSETKIKFKVTLDGHAPREDHGMDINSEGEGEITSHKLYQLIRQKDSDSKADHTFEIEFLSPGAEAYAFTFG